MEEALEVQEDLEEPHYIITQIILVKILIQEMMKIKQIMKTKTKMKK